jgi:hypothetical protein
MAYVRHIVVHVEVFAAIRVEEPGALAANQVYGIVIEQPIGRAHQLLPAFEKGVCRHAR